tara:strand:+ start:5465 stop:6064 length:600 start_codon:yes stop_codon:yes gene_type:complete
VTGFEVYKTYLALKQHFTKLNYDYQKYNGKVRANEKSFEERRDRYFFKKLAVRYNDTEIVNYFVANFIADSKGYLRSFSDDIYTQWKIHQESFSYKFREDVHFLLDDYQSPYQLAFDKIFIVKAGTHPSLLKHYLAKDISLETLVVFEACLGFVDDFDKVLTDPIWKEIKMKVIKYLPFIKLDCNLYKNSILNTIGTKL